MNFKRSALAAIVMFVFASLSASTAFGLLSTSLKPLQSQKGITWDADDGSPFQNSDSVWFFSIIDPPNSNDIAAFQAVGVSTTGLNVFKDDDSGAGTTTPSLNGVDNGDGTITWTSSNLSSHIAFKFAKDWYSVWTTEGATFDGSVWSDTIKIGSAPQGSLSHTATLPDGGITLLLFGIGLIFLAAFGRRTTRS